MLDREEADSIIDKHMRVLSPDNNRQGEKLIFLQSKKEKQKKKNKMYVIKLIHLQNKQAN